MVLLSGSNSVLGLLITLSVLMFLLGSSFYPGFHVVMSQGIGIVWVGYSNPSGGDDSAQATCVLGGTLLVFGFDSSPGDYQFRIESRDVSRGALLNSWVRNPGGGNDTLVDCTIMGDFAYATGATITIPPKAYVLKVDSGLNNVEVKDLGWLGLSSTVESSGGYLYVGGGDLRGFNLVFRVDKLDGGLARTSYYKSQGLSGHHTVVADIAFNKVTGHLWAVGIARNDTGDRWWIELVDPQSMTFIKSLDPKVPGAAVLALPDDDGYVYVVGDRGHVVKFDSEGNIALRVELKEFTPMKGSIVGDSIILAGHERSGGYYRHTIYILDLDLNVKSKSYLSEDVNADSYLPPGRMWVEGNRLYLAGMDREPGNYRWVVYALELRGVAQTVTTTVTETSTIITTKTVTTTTTAIQPTTITQTKAYTTTTITTVTEITTVIETSTITQIHTTATTVTEITTVTQPTTTAVTQLTTVTTTVTQQKTTTQTTLATLTTTTTMREQVTQTITHTREATREITKTLTELLEREVTKEHTVVATTTVTQINIPASAVLLLLGLVIGGIIARFVLSR